MVQSRKEPTLSSADLSSSLDEVPTRARGGKSRAAPAPAAPVASSPGGKGLAVFALLLALVSIGVAGYTFWLNQQLTSSLAQASGRIGNLEQQLTLSGDEASQSVTALQANLKKAGKDIEFNASEIRKLWDTRNVNRRSITDNKNSVAKVEAGLKAQAGELAKQLGEAEAKLDRLSADLSSTNSSLAAQEQALTKLQAAGDDLAKLAQEISSLEGRMIGNEEAIEAIDAYRVNINRQLLEIQQRLNPAG